MSEHKKLLVIVSKTSGAQDDVRQTIEKTLQEYSIGYVYKVAKKPADVTKIIKEHGSLFQDIAVYGGDGSIIAALKALADSKQRLILLPGGTANVIANHYNIPSELNDIIAMYAANTYQVKNFDMAGSDVGLFAFDMHSGWWAEAIADAPSSAKSTLGVFAYALSALKKVPSAQKQLFRFTVDGKRKIVKGYSITVANQPMQHIFGYDLFASKHRPGVMNVAVLKRLSAVRLFAWAIGRNYFGRSFGGIFAMYKGHEIVLQQGASEVLFDDSPLDIKFPMTMTGFKSATKIIIPLESSSHTNRVKHFITLVVLWITRLKERTRNVLTGNPDFATSHLTPNLYVGGQYKQSAYKQFKKWNVTGIVNMRQSTPKPAPDGFTILHLKTPDWTPPTIEDLQNGVDFMNQQKQNGGGNYVHCRQGEGRGPTMAAAYLISEGLTTEEALTAIQKSRPSAHPNRAQVKRLIEWQEYLQKTSE